MAEVTNENLLIPHALVELIRQRNEALSVANELRRHFNKPSCLNCEHRHYAHCKRWDDQIPVETLPVGCNEFVSEVPF